MKSQKIIMLFIASCLVLSTFAQTPSQHKVDVGHVHVFLRGAELESKTKLTLPQGESEILFTNIATNIIEQSISVGADNGVVIQLITREYELVKSKEISHGAKMRNDSVLLLKEQVEDIQKRIYIINKQLDYIDDNKSLLEQATAVASTNELHSLINLLATKMEEKLTWEKEMQKLNKLLGDISTRIYVEKKKEETPDGQLYVKFYAPKATTTNITISYVVPDAGWTPSYDIRVNKINAPIELVYKAKIFQNTGINWDKVKLTVSTGNPNEGADAPILNVWNLSTNSPSSISVLGGRLSGTSVNASVNAMNIQMSTRDNYYMDYADKNAGDAQKGNIDNYVMVDNSGINTSFEVELPYTIPSDRKEHMVSMKNFELPATYRHYVAPKVDRDVFLQACVTKWESLSLLPGKTSIFYEGYYVGEGNIDMRNVRDTLNISLGRDKKVIVRREKDGNYSSGPKFLSSNVQQSYGYAISVRNTRNEPISLTVMEQFPVSTEKGIVVEDKSTTPQAITNDKTGAIRWTMQMKPNEMRKMDFKYSVKYPKDKHIYNLQ